MSTASRFPLLLLLVSRLLFIIASMVNRSSNYRTICGSLIDALLYQLPGPVICLPRLQRTLTFNHGCKGLITSLLTATNASEYRVFVTPAETSSPRPIYENILIGQFPLANNTYRSRPSRLCRAVAIFFLILPLRRVTKRLVYSARKKREFQGKLIQMNLR